MMFSLKDQVALITGASGGFGARFAQTLSAYGAQVIVSGRREERLNEVAELAGNGTMVLVADLDQFNGHATVARAAFAKALFDQAESLFGCPVDILINNAGIGHSDRTLDLPHETWAQVLATDLDAPFLLAQEAARRMVTRRRGCIVNVASIFGLMPARGMIAYATAKAALIQMTRSLALELGPKGVRVNALAPGWCVTDMTRAYLESPRGATIAEDIPLGRFGEPSDLDGAILLLVSNAGRYINGATLVIDGGLSLALRDGTPSTRSQSAAAVLADPDPIATNFIEAARFGFPFSTPVGAWGFG
jgi:NAD(P)-dependent dehydrogenase (short-subunit alcohol dehydrogenase family)